MLSKPKPIFRTMKRTSKMLKNTAKHQNIFFLIISFFLLLFIGVLYYLALPFQSQAVVFLPQGSIREIIANLSNENSKMSKIDLVALRILGKPQAGWIDIGTRPLNRGEFLHKLTTAKAALVNITLIPGETTAVFFKQLAKQLNLDESELMRAYNALASYDEGLFYPETYKIPKGINETMLVELLLKYSQNAFKQASMKIFGEYNEKKWHEWVIIASVIQKEAASIDEMALVSSVIKNRLKIGMKLQMDGTLNYGLYSHSKITPERIRNDESSYNTYKFSGLPKEAVCNVSLDAIKAAVSPAQSEYLYFMRDKSTCKDDGTACKHIFTTNAKDHNKAVESQKKK